MGYIVGELLEKIEHLKTHNQLDEALKIVNHLLTKDPENADALMQVADIQYRKGEIDKATKAVDFLNTRTNNIDPMGLYVKGVLEMEKNNRYEAKKYLQEAIKLTKYENHEILRCYGLCEYWYGNRTKGIEFLEYAFDLNNLDAEVIYNLIEIYLLEHRVKKAKSFIAYYQKNHEKLMTFDKQIEYYDAKISLFDQYVHINQKKTSI